MSYTFIQATGVTINEWGSHFFFPGLAGFNMKFQNSDHKIKHISFGGTSAVEAMDRHNFTLGMYDHSMIDEREDVADIWAKFIDLGPIEEEFSMGRFEKRGKVILPINPIGPEESFILRGFSLTQTGDYDHNIRRIGLRLRPSGDAVEVTFEDNSPDDDGFEVKLVYGRVINADASYNMTTQFVGPFTIQKDFTVSTKLDKPYAKPSLLTGFLFEFLDTDHFIREIMIDPISDEQFEVRFTDDEKDNPARVTLDYIGYNVIREDP
jgi:hypothetical protein